MSTRNQQHAERREFWKLVFQEQSKSDLSIRAFCKQEGIQQAQFYRWRKILTTPEEPALIPVRIVEDSQQLAQKKPPVENPSDALEIMTPSGFTVRVSAHLDKNLLHEVLKVVLFSHQTDGYSPC